MLGAPRISGTVWQAPDWLSSAITRAEKGAALVLSNICKGLEFAGVQDFENNCDASVLDLFI